jgi:hypothetical protein
MLEYWSTGVLECSSAAVFSAPQIEAPFARRVEETGEKLFFYGGEGRGETVRFIESADFSFDAGWFPETREELIRNEKLEKSGSLGKTCLPTCPGQEPIPGEQGEYSVADPRL